MIMLPESIGTLKRMIGWGKHFSWSAIVTIGFMVGTAMWPSKNVLSASLTYSNSFESGWGDVDFAGACYSVEAGDSYDSVSRITSLTRTGSFAARVINRGEDPSLCQGSGSATQKHRAEIVWGGSGSATARMEKTGTDYWVGFSMHIPSNWDSVGGGYDTPNLIVWQTIGGASGPELTIELNSNTDRYKVVRRWDDAANNSGSNTEYNASLSPDLDKWTDWVIHFIRDWNGSGKLEIWKDGVQIVSQAKIRLGKNYVALGNSGAVKAKCGIYWGSDSRNNTDYTLYFDNLSIAEGPDGYALVSPAATGEPGTSAPTIATPTGLLLTVD
jgi:hypothetical protein